MNEPPATVQEGLEDGAGAAAPPLPTIADPVSLLRDLDVSGHFHRDSRLGRIYHRGQVSLRENAPANSLHVSVDGNHLKAHIDRFSPLTEDSEGSSRYSLAGALAHNLAGMADDLRWLLRGRQGDHRCELDCEWVAEAPAQSAPSPDELLDPEVVGWGVHLEAHVAGRLDADRLRAALSAALGPQDIDRDFVEVSDSGEDGALDDARRRLQGLAVTITSFPPLHVHLAHRPSGDVLMLNLNHAATDAFGAVAVLRAIAQAYADEAAPEAPLEFLAARDLPVRPAQTRSSSAARAYLGAVEWLRNLRDRPVRLAGDEPADEPGYGVYPVALSAEETEQLIDAAEARNSTNVLLAATHLAIADWNGRHRAAGRRIGVLVAADLRPPKWQPETIANVSVNARVSTTRGERTDPETALEDISAQIARNKRTRTGVALIAGLRRAGLLALWAKQSTVVLQPLTGNHRVDATVLCNVGTLDEAPSFGTEAGETTGLWCSMPARAPLSLCVGAVTVAGRLHLTFRYPHRLFGPAAARRFAECYLGHLRAVGDAQARDPGDDH
jgi:NRPS condensation-like uncharacterized protein